MSSTLWADAPTPVLATEQFPRILAAVIAAELAKPVPLAEDAPTSQGTIQPNAGLGALY